MKKFITINEVEFKVVTPREKTDHTKIVYKNLTLDECYNRPSEIKRVIYNEWMEWAIGVECLYNFGVQSYNCNFFTLTGLYYDIKTDKFYHMIITHTRNELIELA